MRAKVSRDSINYFPVDANRATTLRFFATLGGRSPNLSYDETELSYQRACLGRIYFHVPGGIQVGQHWLRIQFAESVVEVPFRVFTEEERKDFEKNWQEYKEQHEAALQQ